MIKIIAGESRGRNIKTQKGLAVRPILARTRKSLFDILTPRIVGARFLDLYAGNGVVGLEALSRGAAFAVFVENNKDAVKIVEENIKNLSCANRAIVFQRDALSGLISAEHLGGQFDIIYMGPPYKDEHGNPVSFVAPTLANILSSDILKEDGVVIAQHHKKENVFCDGWKLFRTKEYGDTTLSFFAKK